MATDMTQNQQNQIAERAYAYFLARGCEHGHDLEDWTRAEHEVHGDSTNRAPVTTAPRPGTAAKAVRSSNGSSSNNSRRSK